MSHTSTVPGGDEAILDLYFARDERAIAETDRRYGKACMQVSIGVLHSPPDAEECVNDTYLRTWNSIPPARPQSLGAYVLRIVRNLSLDRLRSLTAAKRSRDITVSLSELEACMPIREDSAPEMAEVLNRFFDGLDTLDRRLFLGRYWYNRRVKDLAADYGMSPNAVTKNLARTRERLRAHLEEGGYTV